MSCLGSLENRGLVDVHQKQEVDRVECAVWISEHC